MSLKSLTAILATAMLLSACATTRQAPPPEIDIVESGFLTDYSLLAPGGEDQARLLYRNPEADFSKYDKVLFDRVHVWRSQEDSLNDVAEEELQQLADDLYYAIRSKLENDYEFTDTPEESAMEIHMALTDVTKSNVALDVFSTIAPPARLLTEMQGLATGTQVFVGSALIEIEIEDSTSREILVAAVDQRLGRKSLSGAFDSWGDVHAAFEWWADRIATRLAEARAGKR
jgi:hypothetical protein